MKITKVETYQVSVPSKGEYKMARGSHDSLRSLVVRIHTDEGIVGVGEAHQGVAGYSSETLGTMDAVVSGVYGPMLIGRELDGVERFAADMGVARRGNLFARCSVETALFDALGRARNLPIVAMLGGPVRTRLELSGSIGIDDPEVMAGKAAAMVAAGYRTIKLKVGTPEMAKDLARVREVRKAVGDGVAIRLDANSGYSLIDALTFVRGLADLAVQYLEQPVAADHWDGMAKLTRLGIVPILADESVHTPEDAYRLIAAGCADAIKIKISKVGGYIAARKIIDITEAAGIKLVIGQGICSSLEATAEAHLACAYPHVDPVAEMVGPTKLKGDLVEPPLDLSNGYLDLPKGNGLGVELSATALKQYTISSLQEPRRVAA
ncbi:MAG: enolase C-terminal domain-like protein [Betaproteobacteria bacterium]